MLHLGASLTVVCVRRKGLSNLRVLKIVNNTDSIGRQLGTSVPANRLGGSESKYSVTASLRDSVTVFVGAPRRLCSQKQTHRNSVQHDQRRLVRSPRQAVQADFATAGQLHAAAQHLHGRCLMRRCAAGGRKLPASSFLGCIQLHQRRCGVAHPVAAPPL